MLTAGYVEPVPPMVSLWTNGWGWIDEGVSGTSPTSGTWEAADRGVWFPIYVPSVCVAKRMWWANGSTVSASYNVEAGIYRDGGYKPGAKLITTGSVAQGTATQVQFADFVVTSRLDEVGASDIDQDTYSTASTTLRAGMMYAVAIVNTHASSAPAASTVGTSTTSFTSRATTQYDGGLKRVSLWTAVPTADDTDAIDIFFGSSSGVTACSWIVVEYDNVDTTTNHGIVQTATNTGTGTALSATLGAFGSPLNATLGIGAIDTGVSFTAGGGYTILTERATTGPTSDQAFEVRADNDTSPDMTSGTSGDWGFIGAEVKRASSAVVLTPALYWLFMSCSTTSATFFSSSVNTASFDELFRFQQTSIGPGSAPATATPVEGAGQSIYLFGFSTTTIT